MAFKIKVPKAEDFMRKGVKSLVATVNGSITQGLLHNGTKIAQLHSFARDTLGRPRLAGHPVAGVINAVAMIFGEDELEDAGAYGLGFTIGDLIAKEVMDAEPIVKLYSDHIRVEGFDGSAEIKIVINGVEYGVDAFETPAKYGTIDTENGKLITDGSGVFEASFKDEYELATGKIHDVYVYEVGKAKSSRLKVAL